MPEDSKPDRQDDAAIADEIAKAPKRPGCPVCHSKLRHEVTAALTRESTRKVAEQFGFRQSEVTRHRKHLPKALRAERERVRRESFQINSKTPLTDRLLRILRDAEAVAAGARIERDWSCATAALREARATIDLLAKIRGEVPGRSTKGKPTQAPATRSTTTASPEHVDREVARAIFEATRGLDPQELERIRKLAQAPDVEPAAAGDANNRPN